MRRQTARSGHCHDWALITGATSGIGAAFAEALPADTNLLLTGRNEERLQAMAERLASERRQVSTLAADLATAKGRRALERKASATGVDLLVANAGVGQLGAFLDNAPEAEAATVEVNVLATVQLTRALLPQMLARAREGGRRAGLIIVSSSLAYVPLPFMATYAASKAFDLVFAESLAEELRGEPVDVLALCPGPTRTDFGRRAGFSPGALPGAARPETVARAALKALGQQTVLVTGLAEQVALGPVIQGRRALGGALGGVMRLALRGVARRSEQ